MPNNWINALRKWNTEKGGPWCVPRKGSPEYEHIRDLMVGKESEGEKSAREERNKIRQSDALSKLRGVEGETKARNEARKREEEERRIKSRTPQDIIVQGLEKVKSEIDQYGVEDIGEPDTYIEYCNKLIKAIQSNPTSLGMSLNSKRKRKGIIDDDWLYDFLDAEEKEYGVEYGSSESPFITYQQFQIYFLLSQFHSEGAWYDLIQLSDVGGYDISPASCYSAMTTLAEPNSGKYHTLYSHLWDLPDEFFRAVAELFDITLIPMPKAKAKALSRYIEKEQEEYGEFEYYGDLLASEDIYVVMDMEFSKSSSPSSPSPPSAPSPPRSPSPPKSPSPPADYKKMTNDKLKEAIKAKLKSQGKRLTNLATAKKAVLLELYEKYVLNN